MNKTAKLTAVVIAVITVISCYTLCAFAENVYANIDSAKVSVDIPDNFSVTNAEINSEGVLRYNASAQTADAKQTLHITSEKTEKAQELFNFKYLSKDEIDNELSSVKNGTSTLTDKSYKSVTGASYKEDSSCIIFMLYNSAISGSKTISTATAYTVVNGELVTVTYSSSAGSLTVAQKGDFNSIVNSIKVKTLLAKPKSIDIAGTFGTVLSTMLFLGVAIIILVVSYYIKNRNVKSNPKNRCADKYYDELISEGIMGDGKVQSVPKRKKTRTADNSADVISAAIKESNKQPSIIDDDWEEMDLDALFNVPRLQTEETNSFEDNLNEIESKRISEQKKAAAQNRTQEEYETDRAESAKRYAKLYIGSDVEHKTDSEKRRSSSRDSSRKRRTSGKNKSAGARSGSTRRRMHDNVVDDFELDSYWDKYR